MSELKKEKTFGWWQGLWGRLRLRHCGTEETAALREAVEELIVETACAGEAQTTEREILSNIVALHDKEVVDCMVPRAQIISIEVDAPPEELFVLMNEHGHSRIPAYRETLDEMMGLVHMKDVLVCLSQKKPVIIRDLLRPILFVAPSMPVSRLILRMRRRRQHMAAVVDEFGGIDGLVTIEDLVEEIVGDIEDEHDAPARAPLIARPDGTLLVEASIPIADFEEHVGSLLSPDQRQSIDTLAGFVFHLAGHIPRIGQTVEGPKGILFDILESDTNLIKRVRVRGIKKH